MNDDNGLTFDYPHYRLQDAPFIPKIFDAGHGEPVPDGFNSVRIALDGTMRSDLNWQKQTEVARAYCSQGLKILWDLDLGLLSRLTLPFSDVSQQQALHLSLRHFCDTLWDEFAEDTLGIVLYRGSADFSRLFPWDIEQREALKHYVDGYPESNSEELTRLYCRDCCVQYLTTLTAGLPGGLQPIVLLDASTYVSERHLLQILHRERWDRYLMAIRGNIAPMTALGWDSSSSLGYIGRKEVVLAESLQPTVGLCLPSMIANSEVDRALDAALLSLKGTPYRVIAEEFLTAEWDGLDKLVVLPASIGPLLRRKLQGFCAAGGVVVTD